MKDLEVVREIEQSQVTVQVGYSDRPIGDVVINERVEVLNHP